MGDRESIVYVHPFLLAKASPVLQNRIKESWSKDTSNVLDWRKFDEGTIECVLNFLYTGQYVLASPTKGIRDEEQVMEDEIGLYIAW